MSESFLNGKVILHAGDSRDVLKTLADCSIDSIVTDPPYALVSIVKRFGAENSAAVKIPEGKSGAYKRASAGFMGKQWDTGETAFAVDFWAECLRVLKPGGHVVAFSGTRTYHRMACAIEDAGFEVRNMLSWNFGSGFPKSHNISKTLDDKKQRCSCPTHLRGLRDDLDSEDAISGGSKQDMRADLHGDQHWQQECGAESDGINSLRNMRQDDPSPAIQSPANAEILLQPLLPQQDVCEEVATVCGERGGETLSGQGIERSKECRVEGRRDLSQATRQLRQRPLCSMPAGIDIDGASGRICDGASASDGALGEAPTDPDRVRPSSGSQTAKQSAIQLGTLAGQPEPQIRRAWDHCGRCGKPMVSNGLGTDLKPAHEPICLARKPLSEATIAANVLRWGTGAINVGACRISAPEGVATVNHHKTDADSMFKGIQGGTLAAPQFEGRWPANIIHDGSEEVLAAFPDLHGAGSSQGKQEKWADQENKEGWGNIGLGPNGARFGDSGSAARFFYQAKADSDDRLGSRHPTVKPVDLMQWLVRLVTPKGGTVLDPFAGTGTTAEAAFREGFNCVLIEREAEYQADIRRRMALCMAGPEERKRESIKAKLGDVPFEPGTLFA